jgi:hypothetical protein
VLVKTKKFNFHNEILVFLNSLSGIVLLPFQYLSLIEATLNETGAKYD